MRITVIYSPAPHEPLFEVQCEVPEGTVVAQALEISGLIAQYPAIREAVVGIFSKTVERTHVLQPGDRLEVYRPLLCSPKEARRLRSRKKSILSKRQC